MTTTIYHKDEDVLYQQACETLISSIKKVAAEKHLVNLAVPGGRSVARLFETVRHKNIPWQKVRLFTIDERIVPSDHPESNTKLVNENLVEILIQNGKFQRENVHLFETDFAKEDDGIADYIQVIKTFGDTYDIIILGVGEDGHIASLMPNHHSIRDDSPYFFSMDDSPKPPKKRMTSSRKFLQKAPVGFAFFVGKSKRDAYKNYLDSNLSVFECPAKIIDEIKEGYVFTNIEFSTDLNR
ncbi:MAG: 6-phosphogluconolactonase [Deltaproteobacteria bacterium]|nr:6-phosphogluconolactonase [Deltaproteobacteria bacterium]